jgi:hypothetical protein
MPRKKIGRATDVARSYGYDDQRYERNARVQASQDRPGTTASPSPSSPLPSGGSAPSGSGNSQISLSTGGALIAQRGGIDISPTSSVSIRQTDVSSGDKVIYEASVSDRNYGAITVTGGGSSWELNSAAITDAALGSGTADESTFLRGDRTWAHIESVRFPVKNTSGSTIPKGYPVYVTGSVGASGAAEVSASDSSVSGQMPAIGLLEAELLDNGEGFAVALGVIRGMNTSTYTINSPVYVASGGGLTGTRPTSAAVLVQNIARVIRVHASTGEILVMGPGRSNDVPNLISTQYLGSGAANSTTFLRGDNTWAVPAGGGGASLAEIRKAVSLRL